MTNHNLFASDSCACSRRGHLFEVSVYLHSTQMHSVVSGTKSFVSTPHVRFAVRTGTSPHFVFENGICAD